MQEDGFSLTPVSPVYSHISENRCFYPIVKEHGPVKTRIIA